MKAHADLKHAYFDMTFAPSLELVSNVRVFITKFFDSVVRDVDLVDRVGVAVHELLENAIRYSLDGVTAVRIDMVRGPDVAVTIRTRNLARPEDIERVRSNVAELTAAPDAGAHYQYLMQKSLGTPAHVSGLGLGRVAAESEMDLVLEVVADSIQLTASTRKVQAS